MNAVLTARKIPVRTKQEHSEGLEGQVGWWLKASRRDGNRQRVRPLPVAELLKKWRRKTVPRVQVGLQFLCLLKGNVDNGLLGHVGRKGLKLRGRDGRSALARFEVGVVDYRGVAD